MRRYRYFHMGLQGNILHVQVIECPDDGAARQEAIAMLDQASDAAIEVWYLDRHVSTHSRESV